MADSLIQNDMNAPAWKGGDVPYKASYGKMMMWFFLITDTLTFSAFLTGYGFSRLNLKMFGLFRKMFLLTFLFYMETTHYYS